MAYKQKPFPITKGTSGYESALKMHMRYLVGAERAKTLGHEVAVQDQTSVPAATIEEETVVPTEKVVAPKPTVPKPKKTKGTGGVKTYKKAYADAGGKAKLGDYATWLKKAKKWNLDKYGTTEPTKTAKKRGTTKKGLALHLAEKREQERLNKEYVPPKTEVVEETTETPEEATVTMPKYRSRKTIRREKKEMKAVAKADDGKISKAERAQIKLAKLKSKQETEATKVKSTRKGRRLGRRIARKEKRMKKKGIATVDRRTFKPTASGTIGSNTVPLI